MAINWIYWRLQINTLSGVSALRYWEPSREGCRFPGIGVRVTGSHPEHLSYGSFVSFSDPDGNGWVLQEVTKRLPGRVAGGRTYASARDLAQAMIRAAKAHGQHEKETGQADPNWPDWYAEYMVREQSGEGMPQQMASNRRSPHILLRLRRLREGD